MDFVLLSHLHGDHFDRVAEEKLNKATPIVSIRHATSYLAKVGFTKTRALETWEPLAVEKGEARLRVTAMPGTHGPGPSGAVLPPVMGSMLEFGTGGQTRLRMYISGDTLIHGRLREIPTRFPNVDVALLHLGGPRVLGILVTMDAAQGVEAMRIIDPKTAVPIHYNDYTAFKSPLEDFKRAADAAGVGDRVRYLARGDTYEFEGPVVRYAGDDLVPGALVEAPRPEAERRGVYGPGTPVRRSPLRRFEQLRGRHVEERQAFAHEADVGGTCRRFRHDPCVLHAGLLVCGYASTTSTSSNSSTTRTVSSESGLPSSSISSAQASRWSRLKASASSPKPSPRTRPGAGRPKVVS